MATPRRVSSRKRSRPLYGRDDEIRRLQELLDTANTSNDHLVLRQAFVKGRSGSGKSALVQRVFEDDAKRVVMTAKCEEVSQPFAALNQALTSLSKQLQSSQICSDDMLAHDKQCLVEFCPTFADVLDMASSRSSSFAGGPSVSSEFFNSDDEGESSFAMEGYWQVEIYQDPGCGPWRDHSSSQQNTQSFVRAIKALFRALGRGDSNSKRQNITWIFDDLQWIDKPTFDILEGVLIPELTNLLFVGIYRMEEGSPELHRWIDRTISDSQPKSVVAISLEPLEAGDICQALQDRILSVKSIELETLQELVGLVYQHTKGSPFHTMQFVDLLLEGSNTQDEENLETNNFDIRQILERARTFSARGIVEARLDQLAPDIRWTLHLAACMGSSFEVGLLEGAFRQFSGDRSSEGPDSLDEEQKREDSASYEEFALQNLEIASAYGLVELQTGGLCRFSHDKIYENCLQNLSDRERDRMHWLIGQSILKRFRSSSGNVNRVRLQVSYVTLLCTDQLNLGLKSVVKLTPEEVMELAEMNFESSKRAAQLRAYDQSFHYLKKAIALVESLPDCWTVHNVIMVKMYRCLLEVCLACGKFDDIPKIADTMLMHCQSDTQKLRVQLASLQRLVMLHNIPELIDESLTVLEYLGEKFVKNPPKSQVENRGRLLLKRLSSVSNEDILNLPTIRNQNIKAILELVTTVLGQVQYFSNHFMLNKMLLFRGLELTLDEGLCRFSPDIFAFAAFAIFDDTDEKFFDASIRLSNLAISTAKKWGGSMWRTFIAPDAITFRHWSQPFSLDVDDAYNMYEQNLKRGELITAFQGVAIYLYSYYLSGLDLRHLVKDCDTIALIKQDYNQNLRLLHMLPIYQLVLNLTGQSSDTLSMYEGKAMDYRRKLDWQKKGRPGETAQWSYACHLYVYLEEFDKAYEMYDLVVQLDIGPLRHFSVWHVRIFFLAIIAIQRARGSPWTQRMKWKRQIDKFLAQMRMWVQKRKAINLVHKYILLEAELLTLQRKYPSDKVLSAAYDKAISQASKSGYVQDTGLAAALAARALKTPTDQEYYARLAQSSYMKWGAMGVVKHLKQTSEIHRRASQGDESSSLDFGVRGRRRFSVEDTKEALSSASLRA